MHITGEHYHIFNRGAHKAPIFLDGSDYERFIKLLLAANDTKRLAAGWAKKGDELWSDITRDNLVNIFAYCLMPNHYHLGLYEVRDKGIEIFVHKIITAYTMYYNKKYDHSGTIFQGNYKFKHVDSDAYLRYLIEYIHLNPFGIEEPDLMTIVKPEFREQAIEYSRKYEYSSFKDYLGEIRPQNKILSRVALDE